MLRDLNSSIRRLAAIEKARADIEAEVIKKKFVRGLGALGAWAAGGMPISKSAEHVTAEDRANTINAHRDNVLWLLRHRLQQCAKTQQDMMEIRMMRELEKNRSVLAKARSQDPATHPPPTRLPESDSHFAAPKPSQLSSQNEVFPSQKHAANGDLTQEQIQMFERDNHDMLQDYESTLDQVR